MNHSVTHFNSYGEGLLPFPHSLSNPESGKSFPCEIVRDCFLAVGCLRKTVHIYYVTREGNVYGREGMVIKMNLVPVPEEAPSSRVMLVMLLSALSGNFNR